ncbi:S-layer glycoprotein N-glycosyltransferase AglJ [Halalkalicoccus sp. NIPERK01]|uniref:S-layer glycoprotein N-glycosyltransferase AglJ n=1 Tax=Halalkalicoccus sp. NIPERK01 TaxID=3053469 RepID=UPI00256F1E2D|nr:S-layer glycoprotein N-glycosyltransferase AglJ [Halalkalicoccus sp. NIPERK01]MDL5360565.1 S-layer glycoprotein N-glycosyltransferase AglJ [Halalkalicoccus sp. NIPERK01]
MQSSTTSSAEITTPPPQYDDVSVVLPTLDEAETIGSVVDGFRAQGFSEVLVVDGNSEDATREIAAIHGARVVIQSGEGKGQAVREALSHVDTPYVLMADGDGTYRPEDADAMLEPLRSGEAEHVIGDRFADMADDAMGRLNRAGNGLINRAFAYIHGRDLGDILSGYRAFTRESAERMALAEDGFGIETELAVECMRRNVPTAVVPIRYEPRPESSDTNLRPFRDGGLIVLTLYRLARTHNPLFYFGSVGIASMLLGVAVAGWVGYRWVVHSTGHEVMALVSASAVLFGMQLVMFGLLSDLIVTLHREQMRRLDGER